MISITALPPEILSQILSLRLLSKSELANCALVCKDVTNVATANLYRDICLDLPHFAYTNDQRLKRNQQLRSAQLLFAQLTVNDSLAGRVHTLILHGFSQSLQDESITRSQLVSNTTRPGGLIDNLAIHIPAPATFLQLTSKLTQLKVLNLDVGFTNSLLRDGVTFPNLEVVVLWSLNERFPKVQSWLSQPRLAEIRFNHGSLMPRRHLSWRSSRGTRIVLDSLRGLSYDVAHIALASKALKSFKWRLYSHCCLRACAHHNTKFKGKEKVSRCYRLQETLNLILHWSSNSLENLVLTYGNHSVRCYLSPILIPSLRKLHHLKSLRIEASMLLGIQHCPSRIFKIANRFRPAYELASILPSSLETLHLEVEREQMDRDAQNYCGDIVRGIVEQQTSRDIHLSHFIMETINPRYVGNCGCIPSGACYRARELIEKDWNLESIWAMEKACIGVGIQLSYIWRHGNVQDPLKLILRSGGVSLHATTKPWDWTAIGV